MKRLDELGQAIRDGTLNGFKAGRPPTSRKYLENIDEAVCEAAICPDCAHVGLNVRPFYHPQTGQYRAYQACPGCGRTREF
jgi:hypothetical protein